VLYDQARNLQRASAYFRLFHPAAQDGPDVRAALAAIGGLVTPMGADVFKRFIADENERWAGVIAEAGLLPLGTSPVGRIGAPQ
jgi:hypothetical protein